MDVPAARRHRTKLVCTIGPASVGRLDELIAAGMDVARLNFSHGTPAGLARSAALVRDAAATARRPIALLVDLSGPKIRLGDLAGGSVDLEPGARFTLRTNDGRRPGDASGARVTYAALARDVRRGDRILLADGAVELRVTDVDDRGVVTEVVRGGTIRSRAGVSVPSERLSTPALTDKDRRDVPRALALGADYVAQSFVRSGADVRELRALLGADGPPIVAKIETRPAIDDFDAILDEAGAVMIARGDLGVELPYEEVPLLQKQLVRRALERGVPSIVATQMLESMIAAPRPTRAEASDVANAVFDGADAVMLSAETAIGAYPVLAARAATRIVEACEEHGSDELPNGSGRDDGDPSRAVAKAAVTLVAAGHGIAGIACYTRTGRTAQLLSALRPRVPIVAFSPDPAVVRRLGLVHGVDGRPAGGSGDEPNRLALLAGLVRAENVGGSGAPVVIVASTGAPGSGPNAVEVVRPDA